jgi:hypothetical protein
MATDGLSVVAISMSPINELGPLILDCQPERHRRVRCIWQLSLRGRVNSPGGKSRLEPAPRIQGREKGWFAPDATSTFPMGQAGWKGRSARSHSQTSQSQLRASILSHPLAVKPRCRLACEILAGSLYVETTGSHKTCGTLFAPLGSELKARQHRARLPNHQRLSPTGVQSHSAGAPHPPASRQSPRGNLTPKAAKENRESNPPTCHLNPRRQGGSHRESQSSAPDACVSPLRTPDTQAVSSSAPTLPHPMPPLV